MSIDNEIAINYTKEAFLNPINLGSLLVLSVLGFVSGGIGFPVGLILTLICAIELLYLGVVPKMPRYRKIIKLRKLSERNIELDEKGTFQQLDEENKRRYLVMRRLVKLTKDNFDTLPYTSQGLVESIYKKVDRLLADYLTLLQLHKKYQVYTHSNIEERLKKEVEKEEGEMDSFGSEKLQKTKQRRISILKKRLNKFKLAKEKYLITETHLETINDAIRYIYEQSMTMNNPEEVGLQLDNLLVEMEETSSLIDEIGNAPYLGHSDINEEQLDIELEEAEANLAEKQKAKRIKE